MGGSDVQGVASPIPRGHHTVRLPAASGYRVVVEGDQLYVLGMARRKGEPVDMNETSFRFKDTP